MSLTLDTLLEAKARLRAANPPQSLLAQYLQTAGALHGNVVHYRVSDLVQAKGKDGAPVFYVVPNLGALVTHPDNAAYLRECILACGYMALEIESVPLDGPTKAE